MNMEARHITSKDNPLVQRIRRLNQDGTAYRSLQQVWLEGEHLCMAARQHGCVPEQVVLSQTALDSGRHARLCAGATLVVLPDALFKSCSGVEAPTGIGFLMKTPVSAPLDSGAWTVVLDRIQDAGNVGSILRSAAAFGVRQVLALQGTAALWSPKVIRSGMGSHLSLDLHEGLSPADLDGLRIPLLATSSHAQRAVHEVPLTSPCAWIFSHEGQGIAAELERRCAQTLRIPQPGGEESLNVGSAAAICLYETARQGAGGDPDEQALFRPAG